MPEFDAEMLEIMESFFVETEELLDNLGQDLTRLDRGDSDPDLLNGIFRSVHTIKGTSSFLGFGKMCELAHGSEDLFNRIRKAELQVTPERMDVIFDVYDLFRSLLKKIRTEGNDEIDLTDILAKLQAVNQHESSKITSDEIGKQIDKKTNDVTLKKTSPPNSNKPIEPADTTVRVDVKRLDSLMNLVGELVLSRNRLFQYIHQPPNQIDTNFIKNLKESSDQINLITSEIQMAVMNARMVAIEKLFNKIPRLIRDLSKNLGKNINLQISGEETELDKTIIEELNDPLIHIIRNAVDHGIETSKERETIGKDPKGTVKIKAEYNGNQIIITIEDDGRGLDVEYLKKKAVEKELITESQAEQMPQRDVLNLIFQPGLSTADTLTNISGRGVGMDVVKTNISKLKGIIDIESEAGQGTKIILKLPLTLAIIQTLLAKIGSEIFSIPLDSVVEVIRISSYEIETVNGNEVVLIRESVLPLLRISDIFDIEEKSQKSSWIYVVVIGLAEKRIGLIVDFLLGQNEIVIKSLGDYLGKVPGIAGSTILGDGRVVMILDVSDIMKLSKEKLTQVKIRNKSKWYQEIPFEV